MLIFLSLSSFSLLPVSSCSLLKLLKASCFFPYTNLHFPTINPHFAHNCSDRVRKVLLQNSVATYDYIISSLK